MMLDIALKEWAVVCDLLLEGRLAILLRKGGIHEAEGPGRFTLEHDRFLLFPSWLHQKPAMLKPVWSDRVTMFGQEPQKITFQGWAEISAIWKVRERSQLDAMDDVHCWTGAHLDMRWSYRPENPLYVMAVRVYRLADHRIKAIHNNPEYSGCKSWVPLRPGDEADVADSTCVLDEEAFSGVTDRLQRVLG